MRNLKKLCVACVLTLVLVLPAFAGDMGTGDITPPPPPSDTPSATTQGEMETGITGGMETTVTGDMSAGVTNSATDVALNLLQSLLSVF